MSTDLINIGTSANAGDGDTIRAAFTKVNRMREVAATDPTVNDDSGDGYQVGTLWFNSASGVMFICRSTTLGAAVWRPYRAVIAPFVATRWYTGADSVLVAGAGYGTAARARFLPLVVPHRITISDLGFFVASNEGGKNAQLALYAGNEATFRPTGSELSKTPNVTVGSTSGQSGALAAAVTLEPDRLYFRAVNSDSTTAQFRTHDPTDPWFANQCGSTTLSEVLGTSGSLAHHLYTDLALYTTWGDLTGATFTIDTVARCPQIAFKVSAVL